MIKSKVENIPVGEVSFLTEIPDINKFISSDDDALDFPLSISQLALAAQTSVHTVRNYVLENLVHCEEKTKSCLLYTSPSPRDATLSRMPSSA